MSTTDAIIAAVQMATTEAQGQYYAALVSSENAARATVQAMTIRTQADIEIAQIDNGWHNQVATTEADAAKFVAEINREAAVQTAHIDADARTTTTNRTAQATEHAADKEADAAIQSAKLRADADKAVAQIDASWRTGVAQIEASATTTAAQTNANAEVQAAQAHADATVAAANAAKDATIQAATIDAGWHSNVATIEGQFRVQTAVAEGNWHVEVAQIEAVAANYSADQQLAGVNAHENAETGRLGTKLNFAQGIYNDIKPVIDQIVNSITAPGGILGGSGFNPNFDPAPAAPKPAMGFNMSMGPRNNSVVSDSLGFGAVRSLSMGPLDPPQDGGTGGGGSSATVTTITAPYIATRGVFSPAMLQQQVNQAYSRNDARTQTQIRKAQGDLAGRGFSSNSPILDALRVGYVTSNLRASIEAGSQIRLQAAQANVDAVFRGQQARSEQFIGQEKVVLEAQHNQIEQTVGILNAVSSLVGGIL